MLERLCLNFTESHKTWDYITIRAILFFNQPGQEAKSKENHRWNNETFLECTKTNSECCLRPLPNFYYMTQFWTRNYKTLFEWKVPVQQTKKISVKKKIHVYCSYPDTKRPKPYSLPPRMLNPIKPLVVDSTWRLTFLSSALSSKWELCWRAMLLLPLPLLAWSQNTRLTLH